MKNIIKTSALLLCSLAVLASCSDDRDNNPTLEEPTTFKLNTPAFANNTVDLATANTLHFSWSQPAYGYPAAAEYELQFSPTNNFKVSYDQSLDDETGTTVPTYDNVGGVQPNCSNDVSAADVAKAVMRCMQYAKDKVPASQDVSVRCASIYANDTIYSNTVTIKVAPYYISLRTKEPNYWYLIGGAIGDGGWGATIGQGMIPLYPVTGQKYDSTTGDGVFSYTGYFQASTGFKFRHSATDNWAEQIGGTTTKFDLNNGGSSDIKVPADGFYKITFNSTTVSSESNAGANKNTTTTGVTIEEVTLSNVKDYTSMKIEGDVKADMKAFTTVMGGKNHDWVATVTIAANGTCHFVANDGTTFGSSDFTHGTALVGGKDIKVKAGTYQVWFNDLTGQYNFIYQE